MQPTNSAHVSPEEKRTLEQNARFMDRHRGERCFVLATGPSIRHHDLKLLEGETCFAVSNFFVHADYRRIAPRYYCVVGRHPPITEENWSQWLRELQNGLGAATLFMSLGDRPTVERHGLFRDREVHYLDLRGDREKAVTGTMDLAARLPAPQSVTVMALEIAIFMGFREIFLLGCDHDWVTHLGESRHFYEEKDNALVRGGYNEWSNDMGNLEMQFSQLAALWKQYKLFRSFAEREDCRIWNATQGGLLDVFPKVEYNSLFKK